MDWLKGTWVDRLLLLTSLVATVLLWQWMQNNLSTATPMVRIYHGQTLLASYLLHANKPVHFHAAGDLGDTEVLIEQGEVRILHSSCVSKKCVLSGHRHQMGDILACVPNRILVVIDGQPALKLDAVAE